VSEVVGTSTESIQKAVRNGIARASKALGNLDWFEVTEIRGHIVDGDVGTFR
jgi:flavin-binding protein dodecin